MFSQSHIIKLTVVLYKVSDLFPEKEPLKFLIRKKANEILAGLILQEKGVDKDIEVMKAFLELGEQQGWAERENFKVLKKEYYLIGESLKEEGSIPGQSLAEKEKEKPALIATPKASKIETGLNEALAKQKEANLNPRHRKIVEILKKGKPIQVRDLKDVFPDVSKRTLRRDFEYLLGKGLVKRLGDNNSTEYQLKVR